MCIVTPYPVFNYFCSITSIKFADYAFGGLGVLPCDMPVIYAAVTASNFDDLGSGGAEMDTSQIVLLVVGTIISVFVVVLIVRLAKRELKKMIDADAPEKKEEEMREYSPEAGKKRHPVEW